MALNKYTRAVLKALSAAKVDLKDSYRLIRRLKRAVKRPRIKVYHAPDYYIGKGERKILLRLFTPARVNVKRIDGRKFPTIIFFHGGGWVTGDLDSYEKVCRRIARKTNHMLVAVDYRLAPENSFPAAFEDCCQAVESIARWRRRASRGSYKVVLMGDSAGGNLAAAVSLYMRDMGKNIIDKQILIYPVTYNDHTENSPFLSVTENGSDYLLTSERICEYMDLYCSKASDMINPYFAPLLADDFTNQPGTLIITAQYDPLRDEGEEYGRRLAEAGNRVVIRRMEDALHGYFTLPYGFQAVRDSFAVINRFLWEEPTYE